MKHVPTFSESGHLHLADYWSKDAMQVLESQIIHFYWLQARKIGEYRDQVDRLMAATVSNHDKIAGIVELLEANDKEAAYQVQKFLPHNQDIRGFFDPQFIKLCAEIIDSDTSSILLDGPALFVNKPSVDRLLYKWHSEALFYGKRRRFVNVWFPIFGDRTVENGAMTVLPGSHRRVWDASLMSEYSGFNKDSEGKKNHFVQLEIPENFLDGYERHHCVAKRGDVVFFDRNLVHTSNSNTSPDVSFAIVCRVWSPADDLTLSGNMEAQPYNNIGRSNLIVKL